MISHCKSGDVEGVKQALESKCHIETPGVHCGTPLIFAATYGHLDLVRFLIDAKADINAVRDFGTPLTAAAGHAHLLVVKALANAGADINNSDLNFETPLVCATRAGNLDIVEFLIKTEDITGENCSDALLCAARNSRKNIVKFLLEKRADSLTLSQTNDTPLHCAAQVGATGIVEVLLSKTPKPRDYACMKNSFDKTALEIAASRGYLPSTKLLATYTPMLGEDWGHAMEASINWGEVRSWLEDQTFERIKRIGACLERDLADLFMLFPSIKRATIDSAIHYLPTPDKKDCNPIRRLSRGARSRFPPAEVLEGTRDDLSEISDASDNWRQIGGLERQLSMKRNFS